MFPGIAALVDRQFRHWTEEGTHAESCSHRPSSGPLVTISRMLGSGGEEVAELVARGLGCRVYDHEIVQEMVKQTHVRMDLVDALDEHPSNPVDRWFEALVTQEVFDFEDYRKALGDVLEFLARSGPAVILGRGANFLPRPYPRLDIRIIASMEVRLNRVMAEEHVDEAHARTLIEKSDKERRKFTRRVYHQEWGDPHYDDLAIHTDLLAIHEAANLILGTLDELRGAPSFSADSNDSGIPLETRFVRPTPPHRTTHSK